MFLRLGLGFLDFFDDDSAASGGGASSDDNDFTAWLIAA